MLTYNFVSSPINPLQWIWIKTKKNSSRECISRWCQHDDINFLPAPVGWLHCFEWETQEYHDALMMFDIYHCLDILVSFICIFTSQVAFKLICIFCPSYSIDMIPRFLIWTHSWDHWYYACNPLVTSGCPAKKCSNAELVSLLFSWISFWANCQVADEITIKLWHGIDCLMKSRCLFSMKIG